jgi:hypothetical protein
MQIKSGNYCPLIKKDCIGLKCSWYTHVRGMNPNTGEEVDEWSCAITWLPMMLIENSQQQRSTGAAVESFRNEMVNANQTNINVLSAAAQMLQATIDEKNNKILPTEVREVNDQ